MSVRSRKIKKKKGSPKKLFKTAGLLFACVYVAYILITQQIALSKTKSISADYKDKIQEAQLEQKQLQDELDKTGTDEYLERMAREKLGLVKANERVYIDMTKK